MFGPTRLYGSPQAWSRKHAGEAGLARSLDRRVQVGVAIRSARGRFHRTKTITLTPRYILVNQLPLAIEVRQEGTANTVIIPPPSSPKHDTAAAGKGARLNKAVWHWTDSRKRQNIQLALPSASLPASAAVSHQHQRWSGSTDLDAIGDSVVMVPVQADYVCLDNAAGERPTLPSLGQDVFVDVRVRRCLGSITGNVAALLQVALQQRYRSSLRPCYVCGRVAASQLAPAPLALVLADASPSAIR